MTEKDLFKLQNGSDVRGIALDGVEGEHINLTPDAANIIAAAFTVFLSRKLEKPANELRIAIGHDSRLSAESLKNAAMAGIIGQGASATDCGLASTPSMFMSIIFPETQMDGSIMITASHNPKEYNGYKVYWSDGGQVCPNIAEDIIKEVDLIEDYSKIPTISYEDAILSNLITILDEKCDNAFINAIKNQIFKESIFL